MNRFQYIILLSLTICTVASCSKFLDKPQENTPDNSVTVDYSQTGNMYGPVSGVYYVVSNGGPGLTHWMDFGIRAIRGDEFVKGSSVTDQSQLTDILQFHNSYASIINFWGTNNSWVDYYGLVTDCNSALTELDSFANYIPASNAANLALNREYKGEVRFMRAFGHFLASRVFGDVPILTSTDPNILVSVERSSVTNVRKFILSEMDTCIASLQDAAPNAAMHIGAVTKYTALLLKAKVAADLAGNDNGSPYWDTVATCTNQIISSNKFSLFSNFYELFKKPGKLCDESLFEIQFTDFGNSSGTVVLPGNFWDFQGPSGDQKGSPIAGWGFMAPTQTIVDFLNSRNDSVRLKTTVLNCGNPAHAGDATFQNTYSVTPSGDTVYGNSNGIKYFNGKGYMPRSEMTPGRTNYGSNNNIRVLRYADALLLNAEALIRKGQNGDAPLNLVRARAKLNPITGATLQNVLDERRAEFACEWWGERYNDLLRTGQAATVLASYGYVAGSTDYLPTPQAQIYLDANLGKPVSN